MRLLLQLLEFVDDLFARLPCLARALEIAIFFFLLALSLLILAVIAPIVFFVALKIYVHFVLPIALPIFNWLLANFSV